jgi:hypothetical protein
MKIKSLLIGMLASVALVGCTNEDLVLEEQQNGEKMQAYINLAVNTATNSSRNSGYVGDTDGSSEDSGHKNTGTEAERAVNKVLYILAGDGDDGIISKDSEALTETFQVQKVNVSYDALVVVNPVQTLLDGITSTMTPREAYDYVLAYEYVPTDETTTNDAAMSAYTEGGFMMANQTALSIPVTAANNSPETAAAGVINVERAIAKITFRAKPAETGMAANVYPVTINKDVYNPISQHGWYISATGTEATDETAATADEWSHDEFNSANQGDVWVRVKAGLDPSDLGQVLAKDFNSVFEGIYKKGEDKHLGYVENVEHNHEIFTPVTTDQIPAQIVLDKGDKKEGTKTETYYVKLENYALTNLSKSIYAVRHKATSTWSVSALGQLGANEYLADPKSTEKNGLEIPATGWTAGSSYFYNALADVVGEAENLQNTASPLYFKSLELEDDENQTVTGSHYDKIGQFMTYCFENAVDKDKQVNALVTGIVFAGQIYTDAACTKAVDVMYKYKGVFYRELRDLLAINSTDKALEGLTDYSTDDQAAAVNGLDVYKGGKCFYYANEIKHFDNQQPTVRGVMEFAIMRNNIYSLKVNEISEIGSSTVEPVYSAPAEDEGAYISVTAEILPWIVRFNDMEF